jgi:hypothetical protein
VLQERALQQLAAGTGVKETARVVGVHRRTVHRWLAADPNFAAGAGQVQSVHRAYNPDAADPLDGEPWVDM